MEVLSTSFEAHPPVVVRHLFEMDRSACGDNLVKSGLSIRQLALGSDLNRTAVVLPGHAAIIKWSRLVDFGSPPPSAYNLCHEPQECGVVRIGRHDSADRCSGVGLHP